MLYFLFWASKFRWSYQRCGCRLVFSYQLVYYPRDIHIVFFFIIIFLRLSLCQKLHAFRSDSMFQLPPFSHFLVFLDHDLNQITINRSRQFLVFTTILPCQFYLTLLTFTFLYYSHIFSYGFIAFNALFKKKIFLSFIFTGYESRITR